MAAPHVPSPAPVARPRRLRFLRRRAWRNVFGNETVDPLRIYAPGSLEEIVFLVREAERQGITVRAVGSGHSWSDIALGEGFLLLPHGLAAPLEAEPPLLRPQAVAARRLVRVQSGMTIRALNAWLDARGLALPNMGGYDGQTVAGVVSTSTHGSGLAFGPLSDLVASMDVVAARGEVLRIEPADGPTDPDAFARAHPSRRLVQDDRWFQAVRVGMGCLGVIYALTLEVRGAYLLTERRFLTTWEAERDRIEAGLRDNRHYELYLCPHPSADGRHLCMRTTRNPARRLPPPWSSRRRRKLGVELTARLPMIGDAANLLTDLAPHLTPRLLEAAVRGLADDEYTHRSHRVLNIGAANLLPAYSAEMGIRVDAEGTHRAAVERVLAVCDRHRRLGSVYHSAPIALRFVHSSDAHLSMMEGATTMMMELIQLDRTEGGMELLAAYEAALRPLGARPHWGQVNHLSGRPDDLPALYPHLGDWLAVHSELNATGVFDSPASRRLGLTAAAAPAAAATSR